MGKNKIGLKVTGIILIIVLSASVLGILVGKFALPVMKYNTAVKNAQQGDYAIAAYGMLDLNYKDSDDKLQTYAFEAGKQLVAEGKEEESLKFFGTAYEKGSDEDIKKEAMEYITEINE